MKTFLIGATVLLLGTSPLLAQDTIRMGTEGAYPPYNFINDNGEVDGFERDLGDELCKRANLTCTWVTNDWDSIIPNLVSGNFDTIIAGMSITEERRQVIDFTQDYYPPNPSAYAALSPDVDVKGGIVAAQTGTIQANYVASSGATLVEFATPDEAVGAVRNGEADAVLADKDFLATTVEESDLVFVGDDIALGEGIGIGIRKSNTDLKDKFNAAITEMKKDGSLNALLVQWFGEGTKTY